MSPTVKDLAKFALVGLEAGLITHVNLVRWGDQVIESSDIPPTWAIDLSMTQAAEAANAVLRQMLWGPGDLTPDLAIAMLVRLVSEKWRKREMGSGEVNRFFWEYFPVQVELSESEYRPIDRFRAALSHDMAELEQGYMTKEQLDDFINQFFQSYSAYAVTLPQWV